MSYFAKPKLDRTQLVLFQTSLDDAIPHNHEVRAFDEILGMLSWSEWEAQYCQVRGQPPIHPRVVAGVILYAQMRRVRSSRVMEYLTGNNLDFLWLTSGRQIDYSTLCKFRTRFKKELRGLFREVVQLAITAGMARLGEVAFDGTRAKANNDRYETLTADQVGKLLTELVDRFGSWLEESENLDKVEDERFGLSSSPSALPGELADAKVRIQRLKDAQMRLQALDEARRREGTDPKKHPSQLPMTDPDSRVLPNKEGGCAPNYTPLIASDTSGEFIVFAEVIANGAENMMTVAMVDQLKDDYGEQPSVILADGLHATGPNIAAMEQRNVEFLSPLPQETSAANPAIRENFREPVPEDKWSALPMNPQSKSLDKACFIYDEKSDRYYCPLGKPLEYEKTTSDIRQGQKIDIRVYRCQVCDGCPLAKLCISERNKNGRTTRRDVFTKIREQHAAKMNTAEARERYKNRLHAGETPFAWLKHVLGLRQFLLRGLEKVRTEWLWACTAYNMKKLLAATMKLRANQCESTIKAIS